MKILSLNRDKDMLKNIQDQPTQLCMLDSNARSVFTSTFHQKNKIASDEMLTYFYSNKNWRNWCNLLTTSLENLDFKEKLKKIISNKEAKKYLHSFDNDLYKNLSQAIEEYESSKIKNTFFADISKESQECVLRILPILACRNNIDIHIDSSNGNINIDINHTSNGILNLQVASGKLIYFSYVGENDKIFKITGKIKLKSDYDLIELNRVCSLL